MGGGPRKQLLPAKAVFPHVFNTNSYLPASFFRDYLTVSPDEGLSIASVWHNQSMDSHPPLYFLLYHLISCLHPGVFSKWTGIAINLIFLICSDIWIFLTARKITGHSAAGLVAAALWGFSAEAVSYTLCARMYMMAAFFTVFFIHSSLMYYGQQKKPGTKDAVRLILAAAGGCLTHHYFYIAAFAMAAFTCLYLLNRSGFLKAGAYGTCVMGGVFLSWAIYPQIFRSLAKGDGRGREAVSNIMNMKDLWTRILDLAGQMESKLLYRPIFIAWLFACLLIVVTACLSIRRKNEIEPALKERVPMLLAVELTFFISMAVVAKLQPFTTNRYYFPLTTLLWIVGIGNVSLLAQTVRSTSVKKMITLIMISLCIAAGAGVVKGHRDQKVMFIYPRQEEIREKIRQLDDPTALFVSHGCRYTLTAHCLELSYCGETLCIDTKSEEKLQEYDIHDEYEKYVLYSAKEFDQSKLIEQVLRQTAY